ncbi:hypothetical protein IJJ27_02245 [bacterium]|nr:hypothetical protein [bacterium]MBQ6436362.1 hypothetical protein [bacterium]
MAGNFALNNLNMDLGLDVDERRLPTKNFMLISGVVLILLLTFIFWIITPTIKGIFTTRTELEQANEKLADYASKLDRIRALATSSDYQYSDLVDKILPENNPFMELQYSLNQLALEHNLTFTRFEYSPGLVATPSADFASSNRDAMSVAARYAQEMDNEGFTMFIEAQGPYNDLVAFLKKLENTAPFATVGYSEINNTLLGLASAQIEVIASYYTPDIELNIDDPLPEITAEDRETLQALNDFNIPDYSQLYQSQIVGGKTDLFTIGNLPVALPEELAQE